MICCACQGIGVAPPIGMGLPDLSSDDRCIPDSVEVVGHVVDPVLAPEESHPDRVSSGVALAPGVQRLVQVTDEVDQIFQGLTFHVRVRVAYQQPMEMVDGLRDAPVRLRTGLDDVLLPGVSRQVDVVPRAIHVALGVVRPQRSAEHHRAGECSRGKSAAKR